MDILPYKNHSTHIERTAISSSSVEIMETVQGLEEEFQAIIVEARDTDVLEYQ